MKTKTILSFLTKHDHRGTSMGKAELARQCGISEALMHRCITQSANGRDFRVQVDEKGRPVAIVERRSPWRVLGRNK